VLGGFGAVLGVVGASFPSSLIAMLLTAGYVAWGNNPLAKAAIGGMLAAATGLMAVAAFGLLKPHFQRSRWVRATVIFGASLLLALRFGLTPIQVLGLAALAGAFWNV
jgi:chromate transport protein ChrA